MNPSVALIGMACRYPDARSPDELWDNVLAQRRAFRRLPAERMRLDDYLSEDSLAGDTIYATQAAVMEGYEFDRARFRVAGSTFQAADLAHWLALEVASDALSDGGFADGDGLPREATGVLVGNSLTGEFSRANTLRLRWPYVCRVVESALEEHGWSPEQRSTFLQDLESKYKSPFPPVGDESLAGGLSNTIAGRICNHFDLKGGGYTVDGACASSLLAVATACSALVAGDLDVAVAGGVDLSLDPFELVGFSRFGALAPEEMQVYDARSAGFWPGEGCGFVVLARYEDALREQRPILALLRGWGISSDGSGGITRPEIEGQRLALRRAYRRAGFGIETVPYFEGHGTGTAVGDPTELRALSRSLREGGRCGVPATVGSIKANIGHTKAAAGVAGLIKATMAVNRQVLPPSTALQRPHPVLAEEGHALRLLEEGELWPTDQPLRAGVSAMGFGGINAHVVLEAEATQRRKTMSTQEQSLLSTSQDAELFVLRARDPDGLRRQLKRLLSYAARLSRSELTDLAATLADTIEAGDIRCAFVASRPAELHDALKTVESWLADNVQGRLDRRRGVMLGCGATRPSIGFLFPGQGSPVNLRGGAWSRRFAFARDLFQKADLPRQGDGIATEVAQPAIVTASMAGLEVLERLGIQAAVAVGHSLGELSAYHWADAIDGPTLLRVAAARGRAIAEFGSPGGAMASIAAGRTAVERLFEGETVVLAGLNSPKQTIVSGESDAVAALVTRARAVGFATAPLPVSHAFHSSLVADSVPALARAIGEEQFLALRRSVASTVTGDVLESNEDLRALLLRQMTSPVRFMEAVGAVADRVDLWIEVGPGCVLRGIATRLVDAPVVSVDVGSDSLQDLLQAVGAAFALGAPVKCPALFEDRFTRPFNLDWRPRFFVNPCELAPEPHTAVRSDSVKGDEPTPQTAPEVLPSESRDEAPLELVRRLIAERADLPVSSISENDRLLNDLHLNSLTVAQLVVEAARVLGLTPPVSPTDTANVTVGEIAELLEDLPRDDEDRGRALETVPSGVDSWARAFTVELVERPLPARRSATGPGQWRVMGPQGHPLKDALERALGDASEGAGIVVVLPPELDERHVDLLLEAASAALAETPEDRFVLVQHGGGGAAFARSLYAEAPEVTTCVVDVPVDHPQAVDWVLAESRSAVGYSEAHYDEAGTRREPRLRLLSLPDQEATVPLDSDDVLLVTGGGKGIAVECALFLAKQTGVRLGLLGRSQASEDAALAANLQRLAAAEVPLKYCSADVTDFESVQAAVREIEGCLGPVTAVLHAAGLNTPKRLGALDKEDFLKTLRPKVQGARNVLSAIEPEQLRLLVSFGSIIARTGMRGQADYAVANEWLTLLTERWQQEHPDCHCVAVEWSVWSGVGMGERLGTIDTLKQQGISPIQPDEGVRLLEYLVGHALPTVPVVVSGRIGEPPTLRFDSRQLPLLRFLERPRVHVPGVELVVEADLSADTDPYLRDHKYQTFPLLPAVMGLEAMAEAAMALSGSPNLPVFEEVEFPRPVVIADGTRVTVRVAALVRKPGRVDVVLRSEETGFREDHFRTTCRFEEPTTGPQPLLEDFAEDVSPVPLHPSRDLYGGILFHSGRFRRLGGYRRLTSTECIAEIASGEETVWFSHYLPKRLVLGDPAARDAVLHAIQACVPHGTLLPIGVDRLEVGQPMPGHVVVRARERTHDGDTFVYDVEVTGEDGCVLERWEGLRLQRVASVAPNGAWPQSLLGPYIERRLGEILPQANVTVVFEPGDTGDRTARSDRAIQRATGTTGPVYRRTDGKPEVCCQREVSAAHTGELTMAIAAAEPVACDVEPVTQRSPSVWRDLLNPERYSLAEHIASRMAEDRDRAATRVWTAAECLKKMGRDFDTPLLFHSRTEDDWAVLTAGPLRVATWVGQVRDTERDFAFGICLENCGASV